MSGKTAVRVCLSAVFALSVAGADNLPPKLSAVEIAEKNAVARGGLQAWRAVQAMTMSGKMGVGGNQRATLKVPGTRGQGQEYAKQRPVDEVYLPFVMELKRPRKMRFELQFKGDTAVQVYDGANGWKLRPYLNRRIVEPFTTEELDRSSRQYELDGPLIDYVAKGSRIELVGMEKVEGNDTYKVRLTMKNGEAMQIWIDAQTFLETKLEGQPRRLDGTMHPVEIYQRDYRNVDGLTVPFLLETRVLSVAKNALGLADTPVPPERTVIEKVVVNPNLDEARFARPNEALSANASAKK